MKCRLVGIVMEPDIPRLMTRVSEVSERSKRMNIKASNGFGNIRRINTLNKRIQ